MKKCRICGTENPDTAEICSLCGSALGKPKKSFFGRKATKEEPAAEQDETMSFDSAESYGAGDEDPDFEAPYVPPRKKPSKNLKVIAAVLAAVLVISGIQFFRRAAQRRVSTASRNTGAEISEQIDSIENLSQLLEQYETHRDHGKFELEMILEMGQTSMNGTVNYDRRGKLMDGRMDYKNPVEDLDMSFDFSLDRSKILLSANRYEADIYGIKLDQIKKTPMGRILPIPSSTDVADFFFREPELREGETLRNLLKSVKAKEINERQMTIGGEKRLVRAYELTWKRKSMEKALEDTALGEPVRKVFAGVLSVMDPDCRVYIDENKAVVALDFVVAGNKCVIELVESTESSKKYNLYSESIAGGPGVISGFYEATESGIIAKIDWKQELSYYFEYNDSNGQYQLGAATSEGGWQLNGIAAIRNGAIEISCEGYMDSVGVVRGTFIQKPLTQKPEKLARKYIDVLDMGVGGWQRLVIELSN